MMLQPHFAIGCDDASSAALVVVTMLDPRTVDLDARRPNGDPLWVVRSEVWGLDEARREVSGIRPGAMTVDVLPAALADRFVADVLRDMSEYHDERIGMAWDFARDLPAVGMIVEDWRKADFSARITLAAMQRWVEDRFEIVATTSCGRIWLHDASGRAVTAEHIYLASGIEVSIPTEREALNHLRSMLSIVLLGYPAEKFVTVLRCPVTTDRRNNRCKAAVRFLLVPREHKHLLLAERDHAGVPLVEPVKVESLA